MMVQSILWLKRIEFVDNDTELSNPHAQCLWSELLIVQFVGTKSTISCMLIRRTTKLIWTIWETMDANQNK